MLQYFLVLGNVGRRSEKIFFNSIFGAEVVFASCNCKQEVHLRRRKRLGFVFKERYAGVDYLINSLLNGLVSNFAIGQVPL